MTNTSCYPAFGLLLVDDEPAWLRALSLTLERSAGVTNILTCSDSRQVLALLESRPEHEETATALRSAMDLAGGEEPSPECVETLGGGWVGHEAVAISVYAAVAAGGDFTAAVLLSVNHSGDSDSTGCITGAICGALQGYDAIPQNWREQVELSHVINDIARRFTTPLGDDISSPLLREENASGADRHETIQRGSGGDG